MINLLLNEILYYKLSLFLFQFHFKPFIFILYEMQVAAFISVNFVYIVIVKNLLKLIFYCI